MSSLRWLILLQPLSLLAALAFANEKGIGYYDLCKGEHTNCSSVAYRLEDETKGNGCRFACGRQRGELNETMTVYFCEESNQTCKPYLVYGREGYARNFERHVMCVQTCHFVGRVEHSSYDDFEICSSEMEPCITIEKINGTFDTFSKCAFQCDGWLKLDNSVEETAFFCPREGYFEDATFFTKPGTSNGFEELMNCFNSCMSEEERLPVYNLCKKEHKDCEFVPHREKDTTKGKGCRDACAKQGGGLNEKMTVYLCEEANETCKPYEVYGRPGYAENFERNFKCVSLCHFVGRVQHSAFSDFQMCSGELELCVQIEKINGTFDVFNKCAFQCDGWPDLKNSLEDTAIFCPREGYCQDAKFFSKPDDKNGFESLMTCFKNCTSAWAALAVAVKKPNGQIRLYADYSTGLNDTLEDYHYPLPTLEQIFATVNVGEVIARIDLSEAYLRIKVDEKSQELLTINTHKGLFRYTRLNYGAKTAPSVFQQIMDMMLTNFPGTIAYLDDIFFVGSSEEEPTQRLDEVVDNLINCSLKINKEKWEFLRRRSTISDS
nr:unnamed protein product [Spirometra erinaceieuropaei]